MKLKKNIKKMQLYKSEGKYYFGNMNIIKIGVDKDGSGYRLAIPSSVCKLKVTSDQ